MVGESFSCLGIDIQGVISAEGKEVLRVDYCADDLDSASLEFFLGVIRQAFPLCICRGHVLGTGDPCRDRSWLP